MEWESYTTDSLEQQLIADEQQVSRIRAQQMAILEVLDVRQVATGDGARSLGEWATGRLDVAPETAKSLVRTMRRLHDRPDLMERLAAGEVTFDRIEALSKISEDVGLMEWSDVAGVRREAARRVRVKAEDEAISARDRFLVTQPQLDGQGGRGWFQLDAAGFDTVEQGLTRVADDLPELPDGTRPDLAWRKATALIGAFAPDHTSEGQVTVIVDADTAAETNGESGVVLESGQHVGREALSRILCDSNTELLVRTEDGRYMDYGRRERTAPPHLKRALLHKYGHTCADDGCPSRYRLQVHHIIPWSQGGETNLDNLVLLCWFHHQVVVHERGFRIVVHKTGRIRFEAPQPARASPG